ncbi:MAG: NnrU family protein [Actinomycetota bacterium]
MALTGSIWHLIGAVVVFLGSHSLTNMKHVRAPAQRLVGKRGFYVGYSVVSVLLLAWMIAAYADAPTVVLWAQAPWMRWAPPLAMLVAAPLGVVGLTSPNPFSIGPGGARFDAGRPGIVRLTRHPVVWALALWSGAHIVPNGDAAALTMFVPLLGLALLGPRILDGRRRNALGEAAWRHLADTVAAVPLANAIRQVGWSRPLAGLAVYALLLALHQPVIGVSPLP